MMERMRWIKEEQDVSQLFKADLVLLYKHSPTCGMCRAALHEVEAFMSAHPDVDVFAVDVLAQRDLSQDVAARTGITHESPQIIIFRDGSPLWNDSHYGITARAIAKQFEAARR
jgi:bacillithiol system protein YtxJ